MARESLQGFLRLGMWLGVCGLVMALVLPRDSGEFVLSVCSAVMGGVLIVGTTILIRWFARSTPTQEDDRDDWPDAL